MRADERGAERPRVFGIGLNKTGTSSLHEALTILGFESLHWGGPEIRDRVQAALDAEAPLLTNLDPRYDAFSDIELLSKNFTLLDRQYPGSWFVLTVRPIDAWLDSRRRHVENNLRRRERGEYDGNFVVIDEAEWRNECTSHVAQVREYFGARDDFLEIDLTAGAGWKPLCRLLDLPEPDVEFPWVNVGSEQ